MKNKCERNQNEIFKIAQKVSRNSKMGFTLRSIIAANGDSEDMISESLTVTKHDYGQNLVYCIFHNNENKAVRKKRAMINITRVNKILLQSKDTDVSIFSRENNRAVLKEKLVGRKVGQRKIDSWEDFKKFFIFILVLIVSSMNMSRLKIRRKQLTVVLSQFVSNRKIFKQE